VLSSAKIVDTLIASAVGADTPPVVTRDQGAVR